MVISDGTGDVISLKGGASVSEKGTGEHITGVLNPGFAWAVFAWKHRRDMAVQREEQSEMGVLSTC